MGVHTTNQRLDMHAELERFRAKLLDLTARNGLLHYHKTWGRNGRIPRRTLPLFGQPVDAIWQRLIDQTKTFRIDPKPADLFQVSEGSNDLPPSTATANNGHRDNGLLTGLNKDPLDGKLRYIRSEANSVIQETGINMLHLALGFLEWYEDDHSSETRFAPLILVPVELERILDQRTKRHIYRIVHSGDEVQSNICLHERLKQLNFMLPERGEDELPDAFFARVAKVMVGNQPRWRIHREALLGFFSFPKMRMYLDLDPKQWPQDHAPSDHPIVRMVFEGSEREGDGRLFARDYDHLDDMPEADRVRLVKDADSSQHSALIDIAGGKNMALEGPPGTGKSQTITNAIADALHHHKTVLFVSEKLAALQVVERNLKEAGLGDLCLNLHSHGTKPSQVAQNLAQRLNASFEMPNGVSSARADLQRSREALSDYLEATEEPIGPRGERAYEVFWRVAELKGRGVESLRCELPAMTHRHDLQQYRDTLEALALHIEEIGDPTSHPWHDILVPDLTDDEAPHFIKRLASLRDAANAAWEAALCVSGESAGRAEEWIKWIEPRLSEGWDDLRPEGNLDSGLCQRMLDSTQRDVAREFLECLAQREAIEAEIASVVVGDPADAVAAAQDFRAVLNEPAAQGLRELPAQTIQSAIVGLKNLRRALDRVYEAADAMKALGLAPIRHRRDYEDAAQRYRLLNDPVVMDDIPDQCLFGASARTFYERAHQRADELAQERAALMQVLALEDAPNDDQLALTRQVYRQHGTSWLRMFRGAYRWARRDVRTYLQPKASRKPIDILTALTKLGEHRDHRRAFASDESFRRNLGPTFSGCDTDWATCQAELDWIDSARQLGIDFEEAAAALKARDGRAPLSPDAVEERIDALRQEAANPVTSTVLELGDALDPFVTFDGLREHVETKLAALDRVAEALQAFKPEPETRLRDVLAVAENVVHWNTLNARLAEESRFERVLGDHYAGCETEAASIREAMDWLDDLGRLALPERAIVWLTQGEPAQQSRQLDEVLQTLAQKLTAWRQATQAIDEDQTLSCDPAWSEETSPDDSALRAMMLIDAADSLPGWINYCRDRRRAVEQGLNPFVEALENGNLRAKDAADCLELMVYEGAAKKAMQHSPILRDFSRQRHEKARRQFQEQDRKLLVLQQREVAARAARKTPPEGNGQGRVGTYTEMGLIRNEVGKQKRHCKLRDLMTRAGDAVQALKPCVMMSPLSVAQYLPPGKIEFHVLIMDEASQIKPEDALGALARAKQAVIVGDPKQLPPTNFWDRMGADGDGDGDGKAAVAITDTESVLEAAMKTFPVHRRLTWHYRSQHESLIAFSNDKFYDRDLVVFPSASKVRNGSRLGVVHHRVKEATWDARKNLVEALAIVEAIIQHAREHPDESLGVGTFNATHRDMIEELLDKQRIEDVTVDQAVKALEDRTDPLFIKNLENLQGDERDVIFIGYTYGPDPQSGKVMGRFGPITQENGWRRLNVLITRARKRVEVFTSMDTSDIQAGPEKSRGVNAMKDYLTYAKEGYLPDRGVMTGRGHDSPFERAVAEALRDMGVTTVPQVGVAGYFIDLGVRTPGRDDEFLLGIECDGATYHSGKSARDRDRLREEIIRSRGWCLHRIWSVDWFHNRTAEIQRLRQAIRQAMG